ncbi:MAG: CBS domain-containing protein [Bacteroidota bacterium]|nr:CBS domain-containing protein [Bacteroidota bacterium]
MFAKDIIDTAIQPISLDDNCLNIIGWMEELKVKELPVVEGDVFYGLITESEIYSFDNPDIAIADVKDRLKLIALKNSRYIHDVVRMFVVQELSLLPVLNNGGEYVGVITQNSLLKALGSMISAKMPGAVIILEMNVNDFVLSQISQICESNDVRILNVLSLPQKNSTKMDVIIKLNTDDVNAVIRTFERYEYTIKAAFFKKNSNADELYDRYDYIMNYLNI